MRFSGGEEGEEGDGNGEEGGEEGRGDDDWR